MAQSSKKKKWLVLAIDFDGTITEEAFPKIGKLRTGAKRWINQLYADGHYIIIWTCRNGKRLLEAEHFLVRQGVNFHKINDHAPHVLLRYGSNTRKVFADLYVDDRNLTGIPTWREIYKLINQKIA